LTAAADGAVVQRRFRPKKKNLTKKNEINSIHLKGIGVSPGISMGRAFVIERAEAVPTGILLKNEKAVQEETEKFQEAVRSSIGEIERIIAHAGPAMPDESLAILETQIEFLDDPQLAADVLAKINQDKKNAHDAVMETISQTVELFKNMDDEYLRARAADVADIGRRIMNHLSGADTEQASFEAGTILIAEDISPSDTILMDTTAVIGFVTQSGGKTSHAAIIARSRALPAVVGCGEGLMQIQNNDLVLLDGATGLIFVNPGPELIEEYKERSDAFVKRTGSLQALKNIQSTTSDGVSIRLLGNIGQVEELAMAFEQGAEGIGLLRTEMLFLKRNSFPSEEDQFEFYKSIAVQSRKLPVTIRTLDIGGDKQLPYFPLPQEQNPFLGYRAIRISLDRKDIFLVQLRAILRASLFGDLGIMFPMISNIQEVRAAKEILSAAKNELRENGIGFKENIRLGIMIEIPSAAITADLLAKEVDFFSIGTNDLCQYTLAADRMNEKIKELYDPYNPGVLRLIAYTIEQAHKNKIGVCLCGELAADPLATLLLTGMGLEEFSMSAGSIPQIKSRIIGTSKTAAQAICKKVMEMDNSKDIIDYLMETNQ
jgi:phosphotransferase system enzyme I (PtsI)